MLIPEETLQLIRDRVSILDVVGSHVVLKRAGRSWKGLCPFHSEKTPSFIVNEERGTFKCFGCGKGGNAFTFLMEVEGKSFPEAAEALAAKAGIELEKAEETEAEKARRKERKQIYEILELASRYYRYQFTDGRAGKLARRYAEGRGIGEETAELFQIGAAPPGWDNLVRYLTKKNIDLSLAERTGLLAKRESGGYYDRFRDRLMFPITDQMGRVVSFGGRVMGEGEPKYLNGPETEAFHKGRVLYGLFQGAEPLRKTGRAVLVEGYMDVVILHQKGYPGCLATLGTALTREHVEALRRRVEEAVLVYDGDDAGQNAMVRSLEIFLGEGFPCRAVVLPEKEDPDSFVSAGGDLGSLIEGAKSLFEVALDRIAGRYDMSAVEGRLRAVDDAMEVLKAVRDDLARDEYLKRTAEVLKVDEKLLRRRTSVEVKRAEARAAAREAAQARGEGQAELAGPGRENAEAGADAERTGGDAQRLGAPRDAGPKHDPQQLELLRRLLQEPERRKDFAAAGGEKWFEDPLLKEFALFIASRPEDAGSFPLEQVDERLVGLAATLVMEELEGAEGDYLSLTGALERRRLMRMSAELKRRMAEASKDGEWDKYARLADEKLRLDKAISGS